MPSRRLASAFAAAALALMGLLPAAVLGADTPDVTGTVTADGAPAAGVKVSVLVAGSDMVFSAVTDASGAWAVTAGVAAGATVTVNATGPTDQSSPDPQGCVTFTTRVGKAEVKVDALPLAPISIALDSTVTSRVCSATATPHPATPHPVTTPPATDAAAAPTGGGSGGLLLILGLAAVIGLAVGPFARRGTARR